MKSLRRFRKTWKPHSIRMNTSKSWLTRVETLKAVLVSNQRTMNTLARQMDYNSLRKILKIPAGFYTFYERFISIPFIYSDLRECVSN